MKKSTKIIWIIVLILGIIGLTTGISYYNKLFRNNITEEATEYLFIPTGSSIDDVVRIIKNQNSGLIYLHFNSKTGIIIPVSSIHL